MGEYWDRSTQIDVVGLRGGGWKARETLVDLAEKARRYPNPRNATIGKMVFTRQRARPGRLAPGAQARWYSLEDLYG